MSKPRICKTCKWLRHRVEPCCSCSRWGKGKTDHYISAEETLREYLERKEREEMGVEKRLETMNTNDLIKLFECCMESETCRNCKLEDDEDCMVKVNAAVIDRLKQLQQELIDERENTSSDPAGHLPREGKANESSEETEQSIDESPPCNGNICATLETANHADQLRLTGRGPGRTYAEQLRYEQDYLAEKHLQEDNEEPNMEYIQAVTGGVLSAKREKISALHDEEPPEERKTKIICISGKAQHGKDTTAQFIKEYLEEHGKSVLVMHYSDLLKFIVSAYFGWNGEKDEDGRALLQYVGTDRIRSQSPDYWTDFAVGLIEMFPDEWDYVILADCRFPNEVECFKNTEFDTFHLRVIRAPFVSPLTPEQQLHPSETALDGVKADDYLLNTGTLEEYRTKVHRMLAYRDAFNGEV